ncbi:MAG TPA: M48 family metallopeptidase [Capsulimonadaceae bacterium]|jgi:Zn-dependent protease with chaperone function
MAEMTQEKFDKLVFDLEEFAKREPDAYRKRVVLLAALGYAYIGAMMIISGILFAGIVALLMSGHANIVTIKLALILGALLYFTMRSLFVKLDKPDGIELTPLDASDLFDVVNGIADKLKAPRFHHILINDEFNAGVLQVPKFGIIGPTTSYLLIGLPMISALSKDQLSCILAHEIGHLSGNHSRFSGRIYQLRMTWHRLLTQLHQSGHKAAGLYTWFFDWYAPYFAGYSFALARLDEYDADRCSAEISGREMVAAMLVRIVLCGKILSTTFHPSIQKSIAESPQAPTLYFTMMRQALGDPPARADAIVTIREELNVPTGTADTHPGLRDRIRAVGCGDFGAEKLVDMALAPIGRSAEYLLGEKLPELLGTMNQAWHSSVKGAWEAQHAQSLKEIDELAALEKARETASLPSKDERRRASLTAEIKGIQAAIPIYEAYVAGNPNDVEASFILGAHLLHERNDAGLDLINSAMKTDQMLVMPGCGLIYDYLVRQGKHLEAASYKGTYNQQSEILQKAHTERTTVSAKDVYLPHELAQEDVAGIVRDLAGVGGLSNAYLVRKEVKYLPTQRSYFLICIPKTSWYKTTDGAAAQRLVDDVAGKVNGLPEGTFIITATGEYQHTEAKAKKVEGSLIFTAK